MKLHNCWILFVTCLPFADFTTWPSEPGCNEEYDVQKCLLRLYCFQILSWEYSLQQFYYIRDYGGHDDFVSNCDHGNDEINFAILFRDIYSRNNENDKVPKIECYQGQWEIENDCVKIGQIILLDISDQNWNFLPNLTEMSQLYYLNVSHNGITKAKLYNDAHLNSLTNIDYSYNKINCFDISGEYKFINITWLNISHNELESLPDATFDKYSKLRNLDLSFNYIEKLELMTFEGIKDLLYLNLSNNNIIEINSSLLNFKKLKVLNLSFNKIKAINPHDLLFLDNLEMLDISFNSILNIEKTSFNGMPLLQFLNFAHNLLESIDEDLFFNNNGLAAVDISYNNLHSLPRELFKNKSIYFFSIIGNKLKGALINGTFDGLTLVSDLDISNQLLTSINDYAFFGTKKLKRLILSKNNISFLAKKSFVNLFNLEHLDLSNNNISNINFQKDDLISLRYLSLENNFLKQVGLHDCIHLKALNFLNLARNIISKLEPKAFKSLQNLKYFEITNNLLSGIIQEGTFDGLNSLPKIDISGTKLTKISNNSFSGMIQLKDFNVSHSLINTLQYNTFANTSQIDTIDLSYNKLTTFMLNPMYLLKLTKLLLNNNMLFEISDTSFEGLYRVKKIDVSYNNIQTISNVAFKDQKDLQYLILSYNNISTLNVGEFSGARSLKYLNLSHNQIMNIQPGVFEYNTLLFHLNMSHNNLKELSYGVFKGLVTLRTLDVSFNALSDLKNERFYEMKNLHELLVDHNNINSFEAQDFLELRLLSIGENPLPCEILINLQKSNLPFEITAINIVKYEENVNGITCNKNKKSKPTSNLNYTQLLENNNVLFEIRDELVRIVNENKVKTNTVPNNAIETNIDGPSEKILQQMNQQLNELTNYSAVMVKEIGDSNILLQKNINFFNANKKSTTSTPQTKDNASFLDNILTYINKIKQELEDLRTSEKKSIMEDNNSKLPAINARFESTELTAISSTYQPSKQESLKNINNNVQPKSVFTEVCVGLILFILVGFILYSFYKSKLFIRPRRSSSTRELEIPNL